MVNITSRGHLDFFNATSIQDSTSLKNNDVKGTKISNNGLHFRTAPFLKLHIQMSRIAGIMDRRSHCQRGESKALEEFHYESKRTMSTSSKMNWKRKNVVVEAMKRAY